MELKLGITPQEIINHGTAVERLVNDRAVQELFAALDQYYFTNWQASEVPEHRQMIWDEMRALARLRKSLDVVITAGQAEKARIESAEKPRNLA